MTLPRQRKAHAAWRAWASGDIEEAAWRAAEVGEDRLLILADLVRGRFEQALSRYEPLASAGFRFRTLDEPVGHAWLHLNQVGKACEHLRQRRRRIAPGLVLRREHPMTIKAVGSVTLPFQDHPLAPYLPAVEGTLNGHRTLLHLDTGGTFLVMSTRRATELGITSLPNGRSSHGVTRTQARTGTVREVKLGSATLTNVPVDILPTLTGPQDIVIMGTNLLERFLPTINTPAGHLLLTPRGQHAPLDGTRVPFYLWADHYMLARGGYGPRRDLTFFIDSGLVHLLEDEHGTPRQAAVLATRSQYRSWGISRADLKTTSLKAAHPLRLGPLEQPGHLLSITPTRSAPWSRFGGITVHGLLSQAFLAEYAWTLDFDRFEYTFRPAKR
ncbi:retropepsin-like aspartic protease [Streptomyces sp. NPDC045456]|uniref:retropepsin-like aspartic protease n=1 Tax=Streptomyces sp. NPDC045456 TaxID=3155254 RepID=UPI0033C3DA71